MLKVLGGNRLSCAPAQPPLETMASPHGFAAVCVYKLDIGNSKVVGKDYVEVRVRGSPVSNKKKRSVLYKLSKFMIILFKYI